MMRGLVAATLGHVTVLSLMKVTGILRGPQYPITSTSFWLHSPLHAAAVQSRRITRIYRCRRSWGRSHNAVLAARRSHAHLRRSFDQSSSASRLTACASDDVAGARGLGFSGAWVKHSPPKRLRKARPRRHCVEAQGLRLPFRPEYRNS